MNVRLPLVAAAALAAGIAVGVSLNRPSAAQEPAAPAAPGRFLMRAAPNGSSVYVVVTDTATGETWGHDPNSRLNWDSFGPPQRKSR